MVEAKWTDSSGRVITEPEKPIAIPSPLHEADTINVEQDNSDFMIIDGIDNPGEDL